MDNQQIIFYEWTVQQRETKAITTFVFFLLQIRKISKHEMGFTVQQSIIFLPNP
jgi:hypothetical protein